MSDAVVVYAAPSRAALLRSLLPAACSVVGASASLEVLSPGSLVRRLGAERDRPRADLVVGRGPFLVEACRRFGFLVSHEPARPPGSDLGDRDSAAHAPGWEWLAFDFAAFVAIGTPPVDAFDRLADPSVARLAMPDPRRSEVGTMALLATLDRARQVGGGPDAAWAWWQKRATAGLVATEDEDAALAAQQGGQATHALVLTEPGRPVSAPPLQGIAPLPNGVGLVDRAPHSSAAGALLDWLAGPDAASTVAAQGALSAWGQSARSMRTLLESAPPLDVMWTFEQYRAARMDWPAREPVAI